MPARPERPPGRLFLLSPANLTGARGRRILDGTSTSPFVQPLLAGGAAPLCDVYASISSLYFRGKLAYARRFANGAVGRAAIWTITPNRGLRPAGERVTLADLRALAETDVDPADGRYLEPLLATAQSLERECSAGVEVVLLGSIATAKYVDPLATVFGRSLLVPRRFIGLGEMRRGSLLLRAAESGRELEYVPAVDTRSASAPDV